MNSFAEVVTMLKDWSQWPSLSYQVSQPGEG